MKLPMGPGFSDLAWAGRRMTPERKQLVVAVDHGLSLANVEGLERPLEMVQSLVESPEVDGIIASFGLFKLSERLGVDLSRIARLLTVDYVGFETRDGFPRLSTREVVIGPEAAAEARPDAFKMFLNMDDDARELTRNIKDVEGFVRIGQKSRIFTLVEVVFYGNRGFHRAETQTEVFKRGCRLAMELGADAIKVPMIQDGEAMAESILSLRLPAFVLGGARYENRQSLLDELSRIASLPVCGIMFGRNVWQTKDVAETLRDIVGVIRSNRS